MAPSKGGEGLKDRVKGGEQSCLRVKDSGGWPTEPLICLAIRNKVGYYRPGWVKTSPWGREVGKYHLRYIDREAAQWVMSLDCATGPGTVLVSYVIVRTLIKNSMRHQGIGN